jgi:hypothetical protein
MKKEVVWRHCEWLLYGYNCTHPLLALRSDLLLWRSICCVFFLMSLLINCMLSWAVVIKCQVHQSFLPNNPHMDFYWLISYAHVFLVCWRIQLFFQIFLLQIVECKQKAIESTPAWEEKGLSLFCCNSEGFGNWETWNVVQFRIIWKWGW